MMSLLLQVVSHAPAIAPGATALKLELPWSKGAKHACSQGWNGSLSHSNEIDACAWDFVFPEGTPVLAAAAGRVVMVRADFRAGEKPTGLTPFGNFVWIDHGGGNFGLYAHLRSGGAPVREDQLVNGGQLIGWSGNTGNSTGPHLHFCVTNAILRSIPARFVDVDGDGVPVAGRSYVSRNDGLGTSWFREDSLLPLDMFARDGITLSSSLPAASLDRDGAYLIRGTGPKPNGALRFFIMGLGSDDVLASRVVPVSSDGSGSFQFWLQPADFAKTLDTGKRLYFGLAPIADDGSYWCKSMVPFVSHRRELDDQGRPLLPMGLPFTAGEHHAYRRLSARADAITEDVVVFSASEQTMVVASGAGRVIAVGSESERTDVPCDEDHESMYVTLDHGDGLTTDYAGLAATSILVREGELVQRGTALALALSAQGPGLVFSTRAQAGSDASPLFQELGASGFRDAGESVSQAAWEYVHVFRADSLAGEEVFLQNGITRISGAPAHTFHDNTRYAISGEVESGHGQVAFLVRKRGTRDDAVSFIVAAEEGAFRISVRLADRKKELVDGPWEWAVTTADDVHALTAAHWEPLALMR